MSLLDMHLVYHSDTTYSQSVLESHTTNGERLEKLGNGLSTCLGVTGSACRGTLGRGEV